MNNDIFPIKLLIVLIKLIQSSIKFLNLSILSILSQIDFQLYNFILISPQTFNLCCLDHIFKLFSNVSLTKPQFIYPPFVLNEFTCLINLCYIIIIIIIIIIFLKLKKFYIFFWKLKIELWQLPHLYNIYNAKILENFIFFWLCVVNL